MGDARNKWRRIERDDNIRAGMERQAAATQAQAERAERLGLGRCACGNTWHQGRLWAADDEWRYPRLYCCLCLPDPLVGVVATPDSDHLPGMCNLYAVTKGQQAIREAARAMQDRLGNLPPLPAIFPDNMAPIVRGNGPNREMVMARWGFPPPPMPGARASSSSPISPSRFPATWCWNGWARAAGSPAS